MDETLRIAAIIEALEKEYPAALCSLNYKKDYELLFATRLSAQCTDERVNTVTPVLFSRYPSLEALAQADVSELEEILHPCGFFRIKARDIIACSKMLLENYGGIVPDSMEELLKLPGVGRKTANLILGDIYKKPAVVADTHCMRLSERMGLSSGRDPERVEKTLKAKLPADKQNDFCHRCVLHGRAVCTARKPHCENCCISEWCAKNI